MWVTIGRGALTPAGAVEAGRGGRGRRARCGTGFRANRASTGAVGSPHRTTSGDLGQDVVGCDRQFHVPTHQFPYTPPRPPADATTHTTPRGTPWHRQAANPHRGATPSWIAVPTNHRSSPESTTRQSAGRRWQRSGHPVVDRGPHKPPDPRPNPRLDVGRVACGCRPVIQSWIPDAATQVTPARGPTPRASSPTRWAFEVISPQLPPSLPISKWKKGQVEGLSVLVLDVWVKRWARSGRGGLGHGIACLGPPRPVPGHQRWTDPGTASPPDRPAQPRHTLHPDIAHLPRQRPPPPTSTPGRQSPTHRARGAPFEGSTPELMGRPPMFRGSSHCLRG
jgi:hypothetical protein